MGSTDDVNQDGGNSYLGVPSQSQEVIRQAVAQLSSDDPAGKVVLISGGTRVGKTRAIEKEDGIIPKLKAVGKETVQYEDFNALEALLAVDGNPLQRKILVPLSDEELMQMIVEPPTDKGSGIDRIMKCCNIAQAKGVKLLLALGVNAEQNIFPGDYAPDDEYRDKEIERAAKVKAALEAFASRSEIPILFMERDPNKVLHLLRDLARSEEYQNPPDTDVSDADSVAFARMLMCAEHTRELSSNPDGPAFKSIMELLGTKNDAGNGFSHAAEQKARQLFREHFNPVTPSRNDLPKRPELALS